MGRSSTGNFKWFYFSVRGRIGQEDGGLFFALFRFFTMSRCQSWVSFAEKWAQMFMEKIRSASEFQRANKRFEGSGVSPGGSPTRLNVASGGNACSTRS